MCNCQWRWYRPIRKLYKKVKIYLQNGAIAPFCKWKIANRYQKKSHVVSKIEPSVISLFCISVDTIYLIKNDMEKF